MSRMYGGTAQREGRESKGSAHLILCYPVHPVLTCESLLPPRRDQGDKVSSHMALSL